MTAKNILMVSPPIPMTFWSFTSSLNLSTFKAMVPPLGLMTVAAMLPENYNVTLIDMNVTDLTMEDIMKADMVFITAMIIQKESMKTVIEMCQRAGKPVVAGGPYATSCYAEISGVDHFILNEAEVTLPQFIEDLKRGVPKKVYQDTSKPDITNTPPPRFDLVDSKYYFSMSLQYSRGCPYNCEFCDIIELFGRQHRTKQVAQFINEIDLLYKSGYLGIVFIVDDNFAGNKKQVKVLLKEIAKWQDAHGYPFPLVTEASIDIANDEELLDLMVDAGMFHVFVGIETPNLESLKQANKDQNLKSDLLESVKKIQHKGIEVMGGFIVGFDSDEEDIFDRQIEFINKAGIPIAMVGILEVLPNTQLYRRMKKEGRLRGESDGDQLNLKLNFEPKIPEEVLINGYKRIVREIYSPENYFKNALTYFNNLPHNNIFSDMIHNTRDWKRVKGALKAFQPHMIPGFSSMFKRAFTSKDDRKALLFLIRILCRHFMRSHLVMLILVQLKWYHCRELSLIIDKTEPPIASKGDALSNGETAVREVA